MQITRTSMLTGKTHTREINWKYPLKIALAYGIMLA